MSSPEFIPLSVPSIEGNEWKYIKECLDTGWVSSAGSYVDKFEAGIANYTGAKYAIACSSGTAALQTALRLAGVAPGDEVIVPTITFIATANVVKYLSAEPIFMDCDEYYNLDVDQLQRFLESECVRKDGKSFNKKTGKRIAAIMPVHVFGNAVRLQKLIPLCQAAGVPVVEDAAESLGTRYDASLGNRHTGTLGDVGCLSFNGNKIITTGGGGMILTDNPEHAKKARYWTTQAKDDEIQFIHDEIGYNYRMTNIQAALGVAQLERLEKFISVKTRAYQKYAEALESVAGLQIAKVPGYSVNNHWVTALQVHPGRYGEDRRELMSRLSKAGIQSRPLWLPCHRQKPYLHSEAYQIFRAMDLWEATLNIPSSSNLTDAQVDRVIQVLRRE